MAVDTCLWLWSIAEMNYRIFVFRFCVIAINILPRCVYMGIGHTYNDLVCLWPWALRLMNWKIVAKKNLSTNSRRPEEAKAFEECINLSFERMFWSNLAFRTHARNTNEFITFEAKWAGSATEKAIAAESGALTVGNQAKKRMREKSLRFAHYERE